MKFSPLLTAAALLLGLTSAPAQTVVASVSTIGPGCGSPAPELSSTIPVVGGNITFHLETGAPSTLCDLFLSPPPASTPLVLGGGCSVYVNLAFFFPLGPFITDANGDLTVTYYLPDVPQLVDLYCTLQGLVLAPGDVWPFSLTNGVGLLDGNAAPFCSYSQGGYGGGGAPGAVLSGNFAATFAGAGHLEVGVFNSGNGGASPNGIRFTADATGLAALVSYLGGGGSSGAFTADAINPTSSSGTGGGTLAKQTTTLALNVAFNNAGVAGSAASGFPNLVYRNPSDSLDGMTVTQILAAADAALAGFGLPPGYSFGTLNTLVANLNLSFDPCLMSDWARLHLFAQ